MNKTLRVGMIGCGEIAVANARAIAAAENAEIGMVMDVVEEVARDLGEKYNVPYTTDADELVSSSDIDAVIISTPHFLHAPLTVKAARAGKHVMVEKPIAVNLEQADAMIAECKKSNVALSVCFVSRYNADAIKAKELIDRGIIGKIIAVKFHAMSNKPETYWHGGYSGRVKTDWRVLKEKSGGGFLIMNLVHDIDRLRYITGLEVTRVFSEYDTFLTDVEVEDFITVTLRYDNGAIGSIDGSSCARGGESFGNRIYGEEGQIAFGKPMRVYTTKSIDGIEADKWNEVQVEQKGDPRTTYVEEFAKAVLSNQTPPITGEDGRATLEVIVAAYKSGKMNQPVSLPM